MKPTHLCQKVLRSRIYYLVLFFVIRGRRKLSPSLTGVCIHTDELPQLPLVLVSTEVQFTFCRSMSRLVYV